jgi:hypothetical protein
MRMMLADYLNSMMDERLYAMSMRAAYLLADELLYGGHNYNTYSILWHRNKLGIDKQIEMIRGSNPSKEDKNLEEIAVEIKRIRRLRFKPAPDLKELKRLERAVKDYFDDWVCNVEASFYEKGFFHLNDIMENADVFNAMHIHAKDPELEVEHFSPYSQWLTRMVDDENDIIFLPADFLQYPGVRNKCFGITDPQAYDLQQTYLHECFSLPDLSSLSMLEMKMARKQLANSNTSFRSLTDEWIKKFWRNSGLEDMNTTFFADKILPAVAEMKQTLEQNTILRNCFRRTTEETKTDILMGEVPVQLIWQFYKDKKAIPAATWQKLQEAIQEDDRLENRWPVMVLRCHDSMLPESPLTAEFISTVEKNITLN